MRLMLLCVSALLSLTAAPARADVVTDALNGAIAAYDRALPSLPAIQFGVDTAAYRDALVMGRFTSPQWGEPLVLDLREGDAGGACARFAAHVILPPQNGAVSLVLCPQFIETGTPALRTLTILHEMVHAVAGPDECRAMAFAAHVEHLATGTHTPVDRYWSANNCTGSGFSLP
jgi:hypothetical protein